MPSMKRTRLIAAAAALALPAMLPSAFAQMMPPPPPMMPAPPMTVPQPQAPGGVEWYFDTPKADPGDSPVNWSARQNVVESNRYERLVHTDPAFRQARIRQECPFSDPAVYAQCVASFDQ